MKILFSFKPRTLLCSVIFIQITSLGAYALDCHSLNLTSAIQDSNARAASTKFAKENECQNLTQRLNEDYSGTFSADVPSDKKLELLAKRCELTEELMKPSVTTCQEAKDIINQDEVSEVFNKKLSPQIVATLAKPAFFKNFIAAYKEPTQNTSPLPDAPSAYRGYQAPLDSPPFPNPVWPYGGSPILGQPNPVSGTPLMQGLSGTKIGLKMEHYRVAIYGWVNPSINISTSHSGGYDNAPLAYEQRSGKPELEQAALFIERVPDTVQKDHFDWGYRVTGFYGLDYRFTTSKGIFSNQLLKENREYGYDIPMAYIDLYFPVIDGLNVRIGRTISVPDIEAQLATSNYMAVHSLMYTFDDYTQTGVFATLRLNENWTLQAGVSAGSDVAPWVTSDAQPTGMACVNYTNTGGKQNFYLCANSINSGKYAYNNMNQYNFTHYFKLSKNWHTSTEFYWEHETDVPNATGPLPTEPGANGGIFPDGRAKGTVNQWGGVNYLEKQLGSKGYASIRNGYLLDNNGQRTGYRTKYSEHAIGIVRYFANKKMQCRPEAGIMHSYDTAAFDNGKRSTQVYGAGDCIVTF